MSDAKFEIRATQGATNYRLFEIATGREIEGLRRWERITETVTVSGRYGGTREHEIKGSVHLEGRMPNGIEWQLDVPEVDLVSGPIDE
jgi:hypothetical protein